MPTFQLVSLADAEINSATGKRAQIIREYLGYIDQLPKGQAGKLVATEGETAGAVRRRLGAAAKVYRRITKLKTTKKPEKRVIELSHMALGRVHYERDQPSKAIDHYLRVGRRSDLFDEALYEVSWVYVKNKQFNNTRKQTSLRAL